MTWVKDINRPPSLCSCSKLQAPTATPSVCISIHLHSLTDMLRSLLRGLCVFIPGINSCFPRAMWNFSTLTSFEHTFLSGESPIRVTCMFCKKIRKSCQPHPLVCVMAVRAAKWLQQRSYGSQAWSIYVALYKVFAKLCQSFRPPVWLRWLGIVDQCSAFPSPWLTTVLTEPCRGLWGHFFTLQFVYICIDNFLIYSCTRS